MKLNSYNLDGYWHLQKIQDSINEWCPMINGVFLDIGCGAMPHRACIEKNASGLRCYIGLDFSSGRYADKRQPDMVWDGLVVPLEDSSVDSAMMTEVLEHCPDPLGVLCEVNRVLKTGSFLGITVPFLWPLHDCPHDEFRYTPFSLERMLLSAGFGSITIHSFGGWDASLAQMLGLWLRRRPMPSWKRRILSVLSIPMIRSLYKREDRAASSGCWGMITGMSASAYKIGTKSVSPVAL